MDMAKSGVDQLNKLNLDKLYVFSPFRNSAASAGSLNLKYFNVMISAYSNNTTD